MANLYIGGRFGNIPTYLVDFSIVSFVYFLVFLVAKKKHHKKHKEVHKGHRELFTRLV